MLCVKLFFYIFGKGLLKTLVGEYLSGFSSYSDKVFPL